ncbi:hypothetical protein K2B98_003056 [Vibrio parahaemolyticus]|nr:hypothetical protein [Vibrio parahaemolyticus]EGQ9053542.1 hypothetical protein [Vibrio parahaemolyticus]EGQ9498981.1 hypothetical protein [Vibrio parahaemolyticus]EGQ9505317.1 hypothetical protein [Vibrio parahaemolyticus]EGQ9813897.1 hypothetical protein [Vibrio parahaemolyticus]
METVIETVQFRLTSGTTEQDVIAAAKQSQTFVKNLPGFLYRSLSHEATDDVWTDIIYWRSMDDAKQAGKQIKQAVEFQSLLSMIDCESFELKHHNLKMCSELEK